MRPGRAPLVQRTVGVRDAKARLSEILRDAARGTEWIVTDRGRPLASIVPVDSAGLPLAGRLCRLEQLGGLGPRGSGGPLPPPQPLRDGLAQVRLEEDRGAVTGLPPEVISWDASAIL